MKRNRAILLSMILTAALLSACASSAAYPSDTAVPLPTTQIAPLPPGQAEMSCRSFVERALSSEAGVFTNYLPTDRVGVLAAGHEVLSESQGLLLCYYAAAADKAAFDKTLSFVRDRLDTGTLLSYRMRVDGSVYPINAAVDDLRILRGLLNGAESFSEETYQVLCDNWAGRLYKTNTDDGLLLDFYDGDAQLPGRLCTLCYSDFNTLRRLGERDERWLAVEKNMRGIVLGGYLGDAFPFFKTRWLPDEDAYSTGNIRMVEALLTALHLSEVGACPKETVDWLKKTLADGAIYGEYTQTGKAATSIESTAVYALCALIGISENEPTLVELAVAKLSAYQITDEESPLYGAFGNSETEQVFSFDNLMALTALRAQTDFSAALETDGVA